MIVGESQAASIDANDQVLDAEGYRSLVIAQNGAATTRLGTSRASSTMWRTTGWRGGRMQASGAAHDRKQPDANIIETNDRVLKLLPELATSISPASTSS